MTRRCKNTGCSKELNAASKCKDIIEKKGYCSAECLVEHTRQKRINAEEKRKAKELKEMRERVESQGTKAKAMKSAQYAFNAYIRERDKNQPCISCGTLSVKSGGHIGAGGWDAGHYRSRGACPELRFHEDNCFKQCVHCNRDKSGNVVEMRLGILKRIGQDRLEWIEGKHEPKNYTLEDLREIRKTYSEKLRCLKSEQH